MARRCDKPREARRSRTIDHLDVNMLPMPDWNEQNDEYSVEYIGYNDNEESNDNEDEKKEQIQKQDSFTNTCVCIEECPSIIRLTKCLQFYQCLDLKTQSNELLSYLSNDNYPFLIFDYAHLLNKHLGDDKATKDSRVGFEKICDFIMGKLKECTFENCKKMHRNYRNREKVQICVALNDNEKTESDLYNFYIDILDTIHCFFVHTFDCGMRIRANEMTTHCSLDSKMEKMKNILQKKRNKFMTKNAENDKEDQKKEKNECADWQQSGCYSFGRRYFYWDYFKGLNEVEAEGLNKGKKFKNYFIKAKYANLKSELLSNNIFQIDIEQFSASQLKAMQFVNAPQFKQLKATGSLCEQYGIKQGTEIFSEHLLSVILYTDYDSLSFHFSSSFRRLSVFESFGDEKRRNKEYAQWSKLLRECVELYGTEMSQSNIKRFYHGISSKLIFCGFVCYLGSPTSTTAQLEVATNFANEGGIILDFEICTRSLRYFNCTPLSSFANEDERLFFGGYWPVQIASIREVATNEDFGYFIHALISFSYSITAKQRISSQHESNKTDFKIIKALIKHKNESEDYLNKFPKYINDIFDAFAKQIKNVQIDELRLDEFMPKIVFNAEEQKEKHKLPNIGLFVQIFDNLETICIEYDMIWRPKLSKTFFDLLFNELSKCKDAKNKKIEIELKTVNYEESVLKKYTKKFKKKKWKIEQSGNGKNKSIKISI